MLCIKIAKSVFQNRLTTFLSKINQEFDIITKGTGPLDACINGLRKLGYPLFLEHYEQHAIEDLNNEKEKSKAMSILQFNNNGKIVIARAINTSTAKANVKAVFNALNLIKKSN